MIRGARLGTAGTKVLGAVLAIAALTPATALARDTRVHEVGHTVRSQRAVCASPAGSAARCDSLLMVDRETGKPSVTPAAGSPTGLTPDQLQSAYGLSGAAAQSGVGQTVAIVDAYDDPDAESDLAHYRATFGLPACTTGNGCFLKVDEHGGIAYPQPDRDWALEISDDLQMVSATCPLCSIVLVEAASGRMDDLGTAEDEAVTLGATVISNSYNFGENPNETIQQSAYFDHPGVAIVASAGDDGCCSPELPAAFSTVTAVGGTSLTADPSTARGWSETPWSSTSSGCSAYIAKPVWQTGTFCTTRSVPDVSADGDPSTGVAVYDTYEAGGGGWYTLGGTSTAAAIVSGFYALQGGQAGHGGAAWAYAHPGVFNDVGGDGFDALTGLGTPAQGTLHPTVVTGVASSDDTGDSAELAGTVNPNGIATNYQFTYGTGSGADSATSVSSAGTGIAAIPVSAMVDGLAAGTTYHYRLVATSGDGIGVGAQGSFTTPGKPSVTIGQSHPPPPGSGTSAPGRLVVTTTATAVRRGWVTVRVRCSGPVADHCAGVLSLGIERHGHRIVFGSARYSLAGGASRSIRIALTPRALLALAAAHAGALGVRVRIAPAGAGAHRRSLRLRLRR